MTDDSICSTGQLAVSSNRSGTQLLFCIFLKPQFSKVRKLNIAIQHLSGADFFFK